MVELMIVVMLLAVLAGVAAPKYQAALASVNLEAAVKRLAADVRRARAQAIDTAEHVDLVFDLKASAYSSETMTDPSRPDRALSVSVSEAFAGTRIASADFEGAETLSFDWRGQPSSRGSVVLASDAASGSVLVGALGNVEIKP